MKRQHLKPPLPKNFKKRMHRGAMELRRSRAHREALRRGWPAPHPLVRVAAHYWHDWCARAKEVTGGRYLLF